MNLMQHSRGGFSKPHYAEPVTKHIADHPPINPCWMDEYIYHYKFNGEPVIIALKNWRKKKGIRR